MKEQLVGAFGSRTGEVGGEAVVQVGDFGDGGVAGGVVVEVAQVGQGALGTQCVGVVEGACGDVGGFAGVAGGEGVGGEADFGEGLKRV